MPFRNTLEMQMSERDLYSAPEVGRQIDREHWYSTLEIGQRPDPPQVYSTLESRQPELSLFDTYKQSTTASPQPEIFDASPETPGNPDSDNDTGFAGKDRTLRKRTLWILVALITVAAAAIGGGVGGRSHHSISSASLSYQAPSSTDNMSSLSSSSSSIVPGVSIPTISTSSSFPTPTAKLNSTMLEFTMLNSTMLNTTNLASIVWNLNGVTEYRVWYQTEDNMIREIGKNDSGQQWYNSGPSHGPAKRGSPIAVSYTGPPDWRLEIDLFYIVDNGSIVFTRFAVEDQEWYPSSLDYIPASDSNLATLWFRHEDCNHCSNDLLLVCQSSDGQLVLLNSTANGPQWMTLDANPMPGTGLASNLVPGTNNTGSLLIFYQIANRGLCSASFDEPHGWTVNEDNPVSELSMQAPFVGFTWNGFGANYLDIVSTGPSGVTVDYFNCTNSQWTSVQSPGVLAEVQNSSAIAANGASRVYAFQSGKVKEYELALGMAFFWGSSALILIVAESQDMFSGFYTFLVFDTAPRAYAMMQFNSVVDALTLNYPTDGVTWSYVGVVEDTS